MENTTFCVTIEDFSSNLGDKNFVVISLYIPVALAALIANIMIIVVVIKFHYMRNITNYFLVNLSVADLLVTIVCMPNGALNAYSMVWNYDELSCKLINYLQCISVASSVFTITIMAVDRYLAITKPFGFCRCFTRKSTIIIIVVMWITSMIIFSPLLIVRRVVSEDMNITGCNDEVKSMRFCTEEWHEIEHILPRWKFGIISFIIMFAFPGIIILLAYSMMGSKLCSMRPPFDDNSISTQQSYRLVRERKRVAWILLMLVFLFAVCWLPYNIIYLLVDFGYMDQNDNISTYQQYTLLLGHANSALNPIIYCIMSKNFRKSVTQIVCRTRVDFNQRRNNRLQWADTSGSSQRLCLQKMNTAQPIHIQLHMTLSRLQSSQKTTKTCAV